MAPWLYGTYPLKILQFEFYLPLILKILRLAKTALVTVSGSTPIRATPLAVPAKGVRLAK